MFAPHALVHRIERAEVRSIAAVGQACRERGQEVYIAPLSGGVAVQLGGSSPFNKVAGVGFGSLDESALERVEAALLSRGGAIQVELSTFADPGWARLLGHRGYELAGYEHVLGRDLTNYSKESSNPELVIERAVSETQTQAWVDVLTRGGSQPDDVAGPPAAESFGYEALERALHDMAASPSFERWLALRAGRVAGAAAMRFDDGIAQLRGTATDPSQRRRGVHSALLRARLADAHERAADLAVLTVQPGSKSQQNAQRAGFSLLYARALWVRAGG